MFGRVCITSLNLIFSPELQSEYRAAKYRMIEGQRSGMIEVQSLRLQVLLPLLLCRREQPLFLISRWRRWRSRCGKRKRRRRVKEEEMEEKEVEGGGRGRGGGGEDGGGGRGAGGMRWRRRKRRGWRQRKRRLL